MKILNKKDSLILRVRKTNQLICLEGWYQVNCENSTLSALGEFVRPWRGFVNQWYQDITSRHYFQDIIGVREDEGRVWHLVTCNLCTPTFVVTIPVTILVTSRNPRSIHRDGSEEGAGDPAVHVLLPWWVMSISLILSEIMWEPRHVIRVLHQLRSVITIYPLPPP